MVKERILIVDDDVEIVRILRDYLEKESYIVLVAYDGTTALERIHSERPDCVLLDVMLPDHDGWSIIRTVRADNRVTHIPIILVTARVDDMDKIIGLEIGADDYVTKPFNPREVIARIRVQLRHAQKEDTIPPTELQIHDLRMDLERHRVFLNDHIIELTATEFDILKTFMQNPGYVFSRDDLIEKALGYSFAGLGRTIDSHIKNLRYKIEDDPRKPTYILTVYGVGYRFMDGNP